MSYSLKVLYSGSTGNATLLSCGEHAILIDAGKSARALCRALEAAGVSPASLRAVFLTHEHTDHLSALEIFLKNFPLPVHAAGACATKILANPDARRLAQHLVPHPLLFSHTVGPLTLSSFPTSHDSADSVGFRISVREDERESLIGYATDLGVITPAVEQGLLGCEAVVLESNHDEELLMTGPYPYQLKRRVASRRGHLSNRDCADFSTRLAANGMKRLLLAHLSETNNRPDLALGEATAALGGTGVQIRAASPDEITEL